MNQYMTKPVKNPHILLLGCGYVGRQLLATYPWGDTTTLTKHHQAQNSPYHQVTFSLDDVSSWRHLPEQADVMVLTIPPAFAEREQEQHRIRRWCQWMVEHRPKLKRLIYISTTGVYADSAGQFSERSECLPTSVRGWLRLDTERILSEYFDSVVLRCGGIYGKGSNMVEKIRQAKPVFAGNKPMYRIHLEDLMAVIRLLAVRVNWPHMAFNLVDDRATSQDELLAFLQANSGFMTSIDDMTLQQKRLDSQMLNQVRTITNDGLMQQLDYQLKYPCCLAGLECFI